MPTKMNSGDNLYSEEKILLQGFHTSEALKTEIGQRISNRKGANWDFVDLDSQGPFLCLIFKQKLS